MFPFNRWTLALAGVLGAAVWPAHAETVSLEAAIQRVLRSNPALRAEGYAISALQQQAQLDGLAPAPSVGADLENVAGTGTLSGLHSAEATLRLSKVFELGGKQQARRARGLADVDRQRNVARQRQLDIAAETAKRYVAVVAGQQQLRLAQRQYELARETESAVRERVERGVAPEADRAMANIAVVRAEIVREHAEHELASARIALAALWGDIDVAELEATGDLLALPALPDFDSLATKLDATPEFSAFALEAERIAADRAIATASARPDLSLSLGVRRLEALNDQGLVLSFALPLGTAERSAYAIARTDAEQDALEARRQAAVLEARQQLYARFQELRHARTEFDALSSRMVPAAEQGLQLTRAGYFDARYSILQLTQAQALVLQLRQERLAAAARYHVLFAEIERSTAPAGAAP